VSGPSGAKGEVISPFGQWASRAGLAASRYGRIVNTPLVISSSNAAEDPTVRTRT
jgi:hypothetical protein